MGDLKAMANPDTLDGDDPPAQLPSDGNCVMLSAPLGDSWLGQDQRRQPRFSVQASRPIGLRLLDGQGEPQGAWCLVDILDISRGGLCLLLCGAPQLSTGQALQLDVHAHPDFQVSRLHAELRWCRSAAGFTTLGVAFAEPLSHLPRLELERRGAPRDPRGERWAQS